MGLQFFFLGRLGFMCRCRHTSVVELNHYCPHPHPIHSAFTSFSSVLIKDGPLLAEVCVCLKEVKPLSRVRGEIGE